MGSKRALGAGIAIAVAAAMGGAGTAQGADGPRGKPQARTPELSVTQRLEDRRQVAAGTRAQVLGFEDGRFYANGWHTTGEMGGIITPPLKLLDSLYFGVNGTWVGPAVRYTSGWGYARYALPSIDGIGLERTDFAPDGRRGALIGLELTNPGHRARTVQVQVDAHSELIGQYPWGFDGTVPNARDNIQDTGAFDGRHLVFRDTGRLPNEGADHSFTAMVGADARPRSGTTGPGHYGPFGQGRRCPGTLTDPMPRQCDDGPFGRGTGGRLTYDVRVKARRSATLWMAVAGSDNSPAEARSELERLLRDPDRELQRKRAGRAELGSRSRVYLPGDRLLEQSIEWGKQNLADLTQVATDIEIRWTDQGKVWTREGTLDQMRWVGAGFPDYPWLFAVDGEYTTHANVTLGQFESIKDHMRALRDVSEQLNDRSGVVVHEMVADGSVWYGKDERTVDPATGEVTYDFNTDEIVKFPGAVALIWRWSGDDAFRDEMLDFIRRGLEYVRTELDEDGDGWPEGNGNVERPGMGEEKLDNAVYLIRGLYDYADMARSAGQVANANAAEARADALAARFEAEWWIEGEQQYADSLRDPGNVRINQKHWIGVDPMEVELFRDGEFHPGLASYANGSRALATRENNCYSGERPGNRGMFHTGCGGGPTGAGEFGIFSLNSGVMAVGEGNYARTGPEQQRRYTDANAETQFSQPATGGTPDEQPGAMPEIMPSTAPNGTVGTPPNIDRCWTCRSMFMQAWGHYGTAWPVIHQQLGVRPHLGHDWLEVVPQVPEGQPGVAGENIRLGDGEVSVIASRTGKRHTTVTDTGRAPLDTFRIGHTLPRGSSVASVELDGRRVQDYETRETNRGLEVWVEAHPRRRHTLVVTSA